MDGPQSTSDKSEINNIPGSTEKVISDAIGDSSLFAS